MSGRGQHAPPTTFGFGRGGDIHAGLTLVGRSAIPERPGAFMSTTRVQGLQTKLEERFGFKRFRAGQAEAVNAAIAGRDVLVVMPTGSGKSLCYQLPALEMEGATVVVSPLISLMKDQADSLRQRGFTV